MTARASRVRTWPCSSPPDDLPPIVTTFSPVMTPSWKALKAPHHGASQVATGERRLHVLGLLIGAEGATLCANRRREVCARVTGMTGAGTMPGSGDVPCWSLCTTDKGSDLIERQQHVLGEGTVDACQQDRPVHDPDLAGPLTSRCPAFTSQVVDAGVGAVFGFPLQVGAVRLSALNLDRDGPVPLTDEQHADTLVLADLLAQSVLVLQARAQPGVLAAALEVGAEFHYTVHQTSGTVSAQLGASIVPGAHSATHILLSQWHSAGGGRRRCDQRDAPLRRHRRHELRQPMKLHLSAAFARDVTSLADRPSARPREKSGRQETGVCTCR